MQMVAVTGKTRGLQIIDESGQIPKGHCFWRGKTFLDLGQRKVRRQFMSVDVVRSSVWR